MKNPKNMLYAAALFAAGFILGWPAGRLWKDRENPEMTSFSIRAGGYKYINPLLECETASGRQLKELIPFKTRIGEVVNAQIQKKNLSEASVYFRDLNNGPWFGINETRRFAPASLLKVGVMMAYYKWAETEPDVLRRQIQFGGTALPMPNQTIPAGKKLKTGGIYTIDELIEQMIIYSDNEADIVLLNYLGEARFLDIFKKLDIELNAGSMIDDIMSVKKYGSLFRILYNASYLSKDYSEKALGLLTRTKFAKGLTAHLPADLQLAHKFGERTIGDVKQLHDCGIIYFPGNPYLLCVMSRGRDIKLLESGIAEISKTAFKEVSAQAKR